MNKDIISGKWTQLKGKAQDKWGDLTNDVFDIDYGLNERLEVRSVYVGRDYLYDLVKALAE